MTALTPLGPVMLDLAGPELRPDEQHRLLHPAVGGVILFTRNYQNPDQLGRLVDSIRAVRGNVLIAVDHEGGRVQRFRNGFCRLPPAARYRQCRDEADASSIQIAEMAGWLMAAELRSVDIDFSFAPVLDVDCNVSEVIGDRAFSDNAAETSLLGGAFLRGMHRAGMAGVGKHFPGHGSVAEDSHKALPVDGRAWDEIRQRDLEPFRSLIEAGLEGVMPAHVLYPCCDALPAGYSSFWIRKVLRGELNFSGVVFSDDLSMGGAGFAGDLPARALAALSAGCDMLLVCNTPEQLDPVLDAVAGQYAPDTDARLAPMRGKFPLDRATLKASTEWREAVATIQKLTENVT